LIQVDGGIDLKNIGSLSDAGVDVFVIGIDKSIECLCGIKRPRVFFSP
jgi:3-keto-L-gulonate-6-phosphate decarboxylase